MVKPVDKPGNERSLREALRAKLDQMSGPRLTELNEIISQWELDGLSEKLDQAFDSDRREGKLTEEKVSQTIAEHRAHHPYDR